MCFNIYTLLVYYTGHLSWLLFDMIGNFKSPLRSTERYSQWFLADDMARECISNSDADDMDGTWRGLLKK